MSRLPTSLLLPLLVGVLASGCGEPRQVTYVDPNGPGTTSPAGDGGEPFMVHGAAVVERARACIGVRGSLAVARTIAVNDPAEAGEVLDTVLEEVLPVIEPRGIAMAAAPTRRLRAGIESLRDDPPSEVADYNLAVRRLADELLPATCDAVVPAAARQDVSFRAALLHESLQEAATAYEESFDGSRDEIELDAPYRRAYGLLIDASTRQLESVPEDARPRLRQTLDSITRRATPGPTPPEDPHDPDIVVGDLAALADDVLVAAQVDATYPSPTPDAPDQLRSLKRAIATAVEAHERDASQDALSTLRSADASWLAPAASSIASVSPTLLAELEHDVLVALPEAIRSDGDVASLASETDVRIDDGISLLEEELELLREEP